MSDDQPTMSVPSTGARVCLLIAVLLGIWTVYLMTAPIVVQGTKLQRFDCGSVLQGPKTNFARGICGKAGDAEKAKSTAAGVATVVVAVGGFLVFGLTTRPRRRVHPEGLDGDGRERRRNGTDAEEGQDAEEVADSEVVDDEPADHEVVDDEPADHEVVDDSESSADVEDDPGPGGITRSSG